MEAEHQNHAEPQAPNVGGLIAEVEHKMSELMNWHQAQSSQFDEEKNRFNAELQQQREALNSEREAQAKQLQEQAEQQTQALQVLEAARPDFPPDPTSLLDIAQVIVAYVAAQ